jgi:hypothetical protein
MSFASSMEAKEFLVSRIVEEASRQQVRLSELERKMLYFSEGYPTLPDMMEVNEQFDAQYDSEKYEEKIRGLSKSAIQRDQKESPQMVLLWQEAVKVLNKEDHYILLMLDVPRSGKEVAKGIPLVPVKWFIPTLIVGALAVAAGVALRWSYLNVHFKIPDSIAMLGFIVVFVLGCYLVYSKKWDLVGAYASKLFERVARWF